MGMHQTMEGFDDDENPFAGLLDALNAMFKAIAEHGATPDFLTPTPLRDQTDNPPPAFFYKGFAKESTMGTSVAPSYPALFDRARKLAFERVFQSEPLGDPPTLESLIGEMGTEYAARLETLRRSVQDFNYAYDDCHQFTLAERRRIEFEAHYRDTHPESK